LILFVCLLAAIILRPVILPLIFSFILYSQLEPLTNKLLSQGFSESTATSIILFGLIGLIIFCVILLFPVLFDQLSSLQEKLPVIWHELLRQTHSVAGFLNKKFNFDIDINNFSENLVEKIQTWGTSTALSSAGIVVDFFVVILLIPIVTFFLMRDYEGLRNRMLGWLPNRSFELGCLMYYKVTEQLQKYIRGVLIQSGIVAVITTIGFYFVGVEMAIIFGILAGLFNMIPYVGPILAIVPPVLMLLGSGADVFSIVAVISVVLAAQLFDNLVTIPVFIANTVGLHALVVLLGVIVFGYFFGFIGMLIAIPVLATSKIVFMGFLHGLHRAPLESE
jgi:predicted PurR-regulated permease PerM